MLAWHFRWERASFKVKVTPQLPAITTIMTRCGTDFSFIGLFYYLSVTLLASRLIAEITRALEINLYPGLQQPNSHITDLGILLFCTVKREIKMYPLFDYAINFKFMFLNWLDFMYAKPVSSTIVQELVIPAFPGTKWFIFHYFYFFRQSFVVFTQFF